MATPRGIEAMVNEQVRRWELGARSAKEAVRRPCVAFSRLPYSGGGEVAERVAADLSFGLFGKEIVEQISRERGIGARLVEGCDERIRSAIDRFVTDAFRAGAFAESDYLRHVVRIVTTLGKRGMAVIVGRGAPYILPPERALRVLIVAPLEQRTRKLAAAEGLSAEQAAVHLAERDKWREEFVRCQFGLEQRAPELYDLVANTGTLSLDVAARVVAETYRYRFERQGATSPVAAG